MTNKPLISVVIPTYNEHENIGLLIEDLCRNLHKYNFEIIVVDDYSTDGTINSLKKISKKNQNVRYFLNPPPRGLSKSILLGIKKSKGDIIVGMDADFNHDPEIITNLIEEIIENKNDVVFASRFIKGGGMENKLRFYFTFLFNLILKTIFSFPASDNASGYYAISSKVLKNFPLKDIYRGYGEYHLRLVYQIKKLSLKNTEIPVFYKKRRHGESKSRLFKMFISYLRVALELRLGL